jgi:hypothetical protein
LKFYVNKFLRQCSFGSVKFCVNEVLRQWSFTSIHLRQWIIYKPSFRYDLFFKRFSMQFFWSMFVLISKDCLCYIAYVFSLGNQSSHAYEITTCSFGWILLIPYFGQRFGFGWTQFLSHAFDIVLSLECRQN